MEEIMAQAECYIKGEENNAEKRTWVAREQGGQNSKVSDQRMNHNAISIREKVAFKPSRRPLEQFTQLDTSKEQIPQDVYLTKVIHKHLSPKRTVPKGLTMLI